MKLDSLEQLFIDQISDLKSAEDQLIKALPKMAKAADSPDLQQAFEQHWEQTRAQADRLSEISGRLDLRIPTKTCQAMKGLIKEGVEVIKATGDASVKDAALIAAAQRVEHYEIAAYGCARTFAELLGDSDAAKQLQLSLNEEVAADKNLNRLAKGLINQEAASASAS